MDSHSHPLGPTRSSSSLLSMHDPLISEDSKHGDHPPSPRSCSSIKAHIRCCTAAAIQAPFSHQFPRLPGPHAEHTIPTAKLELPPPSLLPVYPNLSSFEPIRPFETMPLTSRWNLDIPNCSLQQWIFGNSSGPLPNRQIFIDAENPRRYLTLGDYRLYSKRVAAGLRAAGLQTGDRVLLFSGNNLFFPTIFLGVLMAGGIFTGANPTFVARELAFQLSNSGASFLFVAEQALPIALEATKAVGLPASRIFVFDDKAFDQDIETARSLTYQNNVRHWSALLVNKEDGDKFSWVEPKDADSTTCCLNYSSGTTGVPKGVEISHRSYIANGVGVVHLASLQEDFDAYLKRARGLCFLPMYHAYAQTYFVANFAKLGIPTYIMQGAFDFEKMLKHVQEYRITTLTCVPPIVVALAKHPFARKYDLSSVETLGSGAAPLGHEVAMEVEKLWADVHHADGKAVKKNQPLLLRQGWGMTEVTCTCLAWDPTHPATSTAAVGELLPNCSGKLMDINSDDSADFVEITTPETRGELWVTGPTLMKGYWRNEKATKESIVIDENGTRWFRTGDIAYFDGSYRPGALFFIVDRIKELIKVKGNQVAPAELEALLLERHDIADVAVIGVPVQGEEVPRAYVVPVKPLKTFAAQEAVAEDISQWLASKTARFKWLRGGVEFTDAIPKNPSGKILRRQLKDRARKEISAKL